jgi:hypothetical protein
MLAAASLSKEGVEGVIGSSNGLVRRHLAIRLDAMLKAAKINRKLKTAYPLVTRSLKNACQIKKFYISLRSNVFGLLILFYEL